MDGAIDLLQGRAVQVNVAGKHSKKSNWENKD